MSRARATDSMDIPSLILVRGEGKEAVDGDNGNMRTHAQFISDTGDGVPRHFRPCSLKSFLGLQAQCGLKICTWEAHIGCSLSPLGFVVVITLGTVIVGLWTLWRDGLLLTGYHLVAGSGLRNGYREQPLYDVRYSAAYRGW